VQELDDAAAELPTDLRPDEMKDRRVRPAHVEDTGVLAELIAAFSRDQGDAAAVAQRMLAQRMPSVQLGITRSDLDLEFHIDPNSANELQTTPVGGL
jgi:hypothetical protein